VFDHNRRTIAALSVNRHAGCLLTAH
jgi:hypothetical protein